MSLKSRSFRTRIFKHEQESIKHYELSHKILKYQEKKLNFENNHINEKKINNSLKELDRLKRLTSA